MAGHGLSDLALVTLLGVTVGLTVWLCGRYLDRPSDHRVVRSRPGRLLLVAGLASGGMLVFHFLVMNILPHHLVPGQAIDVSTVLRIWPQLPIAAFVPLGAALLGYWASVIVVVVVLQVVAAIGLSVVAYSGVGLIASDAGQWGPDFFLGMLVIFGLPASVVLGLVVWLIGWAGALFGGRPRPGIKPLLLTILLAYASWVVAFLGMLGMMSIRLNGGPIMVFLPPAGTVIGYWLFTRSPARAINEIGRKK
jgi:hypothetical protein